jgi:SAM-dependent methyltransferase
MKERLAIHLMPLERGQKIFYWDDSCIKPGTEWKKELRSALDSATVAILLVSPDFLASGFIQEEEVPKLLEASRRNGCRIVPVIVAPCHFTESILAQYQVFNERPLSLLQRPQRDVIFKELVGDISKMAQPREDESAADGDSDTSVYRTSILRLMSLWLKQHGIDLSFHRPIISSLDFTIRDLEKLCAEHFRQYEDDQITDLLDQARIVAYDEKYGERTTTEGDDERWTQPISKWIEEVERILSNQLGLETLDDLAVVNVGVGNGSEGKGLYERFDPFYAVDISPKALEQTKRSYENANCVPAAAERLKLPRDCAELYLSFRTFQSTLLDVNRALYEAVRILIPGGSLLISIPNKYVQVNQRGEPVLTTGLIPPEVTHLDPTVPYPLDPELPWKHINKIRRTLLALDFEDVGVYTGMFEIYVYGKRPRPKKPTGSRA